MLCNRWHRQIESCPGINQNHFIDFHFLVTHDSRLRISFRRIARMWAIFLNENPTDRFSHSGKWLLTFATEPAATPTYMLTHRRFVSKQTILTKVKMLANFIWKSNRKGNRCFQVQPDARITFNFPRSHESAMQEHTARAHSSSLCLGFRSIWNMHEAWMGKPFVRPFVLNNTR